MICKDRLISGLAFRIGQARMALKHGDEESLKSAINLSAEMLARYELAAIDDHELSIGHQRDGWKEEYGA